MTQKTVMVETNRLPGQAIGDFCVKHWSMKYGDWQKRNENYDRTIRQRCITKYLRDVEKFAPYWLDEFASIDKSLGWEENTFAAMELFGDACPVAPHECTSWILWRDYTGCNKVVLHKIRDSHVHELDVTLRQVPGYHKWLGIGDLGRLSPCMGINEHGLAVVMNSGEPSMENEDAGLTTPDIARLLLEQCANANEALELYRRIIDSHSYAHGSTGTIFFLTDKDNGIVIENTAHRMAYGKLDYGFLIRSNSWHLPGIEAYSRASLDYTHGCEFREVQVRSSLQKYFRTNGSVSLEDSWAISRDREGGEHNKNNPVRALCTMFTNSCSTFEIDREYPDVLTTAFITIGPPCHTAFIPMPIVIEEIPESMVSGQWAATAFAKRAEINMEADIAPLQSLEMEMMAVYRTASERARELMKMGARAGAVAELQRAFAEICAMAEPKMI